MIEPQDFRRWTPLLDASSDCWDAIRAILTDLLDHISAITQTHGTKDDVSWAEGAPGLAMFTYMAAIALQDDQLATRTEQLITGGFASAVATPVFPSLFGGLVGCGAVAEYLSRKSDSGSFDPNEALDAHLATVLEACAPGFRFDLTSGLVGVAVYALMRPDTANTRRILAAIVGEFDRRATISKDGIFWETTRAQMLPPELEAYSGNVTCTGVAHGQAGILGIIAQCVARDVAPLASKRLLARSGSWLAAQFDQGAQYTAFPNHVPEQAFRSGRALSWCYGDLGIALSLLVASSATGTRDLEALALQAAYRAAGRSVSDAGLREAGLCHGTAGAMLAFSRLYQLTGDIAFREAALRWLNVTLSLRVPGQGAGGFRARDMVSGEWCAARGMLIGAAGVGAALLSAVTSHVPDWDYMLLMSPAVQVLS